MRISAVRYGANQRYKDVTNNTGVFLGRQSDDKHQIFLIDSRQNFNTLFGDVCPQVEKRLELHLSSQNDNEQQISLLLPEKRNANYSVETSPESTCIAISAPNVSLGDNETQNRSAAVATTSLLSGGIPKVIMQYWSDGDVPAPEWAKQRTAKLRTTHNDFEYFLFSRSQAIAWIGKHFKEWPDVLVAFRKCKIAAMESDFFRYCFLYKVGGFYVDLKTVCLRSFLDQYAKKPSIEMLLIRRKHPLLYNGLIGSVAGCLALRETVAECVENILQEKHQVIYPTTGTPVLTKNCQAIYGPGYRIFSHETCCGAETIDYDEQKTCPIVFQAATYVKEHWHIVEKKIGIYNTLDLKKLLQVDNIFVLNLDSRSDRLQECRDEFRNLLVSNDQWERFPAWRGDSEQAQSQFASEFEAFCNNATTKNRSATPSKYLQGGFGCLLSHYHMIKTAKERGYKRLLVLEDDFQATEAMHNADLLEKIGSAKFDMFYLSMSIMAPPETIVESNGETSIFVRQKRALSTGAYIVCESVFDIILDQCLCLATQIDLFYAQVVQAQFTALSLPKCLIVQREGYSDIVGRNIKYKFIT